MHKSLAMALTTLFSSLLPMNAHADQSIEQWKQSAALAKKADFAFAIDEVFAIDRSGAGTIAIAGTVLKGKAGVGDLVRIPLVNGKFVIAPIAGIEMFQNGARKNLDLAFPGDMLGILFKGVAKGDVQPGKAIVMEPAQ